MLRFSRRRSWCNTRAGERNSTANNDTRSNLKEKSPDRWPDTLRGSHPCPACDSPSVDTTPLIILEGGRSSSSAVPKLCHSKGRDGEALAKRRGSWRMFPPLNVTERVRIRLLVEDACWVLSPLANGSKSTMSICGSQCCATLVRDMYVSGLGRGGRHPNGGLGRGYTTQDFLVQP